MFCCQLNPVVARPGRKNTVELDAVAELVERCNWLQRVEHKLRANERDKEHTWRPSVWLPGQIYRYREDEAPCALIGGPDRSWS